MGYIHCCGGLRKTQSFTLIPNKEFVVCELDYLKKCPICGNTVVQLTRISKDENISPFIFLNGNIINIAKGY